jgi:hypothetical protein
LTFLLLISLPACNNVPLSLEVEAAEHINAADGFENEEIDVNPEETKLDEIEYKTIEPPEDGWTLELLNEVTYINGKDIDLPFCLNDLGEGFEFESYGYARRTGLNYGDLLSNNKFICMISFPTSGESDYKNSYYLDCIFSSLGVTKSSSSPKEFLTANGIIIGSTLEDTLKSFGNDYTETTRGVYAYFLNKNEGRIAFFTNEKSSTVSGICINIYEKGEENG